MSTNGNSWRRPPEQSPVSEEEAAWAAAMNDDMAGVITAIGFLSQERIARLSEAAQMLDDQCLYFLDTKATPSPPKNPSRHPEGRK